MKRLVEFARRAPITSLLLVACTAMFVVMCIEGGFEGNGPAFSEDTLRHFGGLLPDRVWEGESWRLLTAALVHGDPLHLLFNSWALVALGPAIERVLSPARTLLLVVGAQLGCATTHVIFGSLSTLIGASGIACGLLGGLLVVLLRRSDPPAMAGRRTLIFWALQVVVFSLAIPGISLLGHLGGGLAGAALMIGLEPSPEHRMERAISVFFACALLGVAVRLALVEPDRPNWNLVKGVNLYEQKHFQDALPYLQRGIALGGGDFRKEVVHALIGDSLLELHDRDAGRPELAEGAEEGSSYAAERLARDADDAHQSLAYLSRALELVPHEPMEHPEAREGAIQELMGDWLQKLLEITARGELPRDADLAPLIHVPETPLFSAVEMVRDGGPGRTPAELHAELVVAAAAVAAIDAGPSTDLLHADAEPTAPPAHEGVAAGPGHP